MPLFGEDLRYLAAVSDLARLDLESGSVGLLASDGRITSRYQSPYAMGERYMDYDGSDFACEIDAERLKALAGLFPEKQAVVLTLDNHTLSIKGKGAGARSVSLQTQRNEVEEHAELDTAKADIVTRIKLDDLRSEFELARNFTAKNYAQPLLTGVNLHFTGKDNIRLSAWDSVSALFASSVETFGKTKGGSVEVTVPDLDFELGLKVLGSGEARLEVVLREQDDGLRPARLRVVGASAFFSCTPLIGEWPDLSPVTRKGSYSVSINLDGQALRDAVAGVKALSPNYAKSGIKIRTDSKRRLLVQTLEAEHGQFVVRGGGEAETDVDFTYSTANMSLAALLGERLTFDIPEDVRSQTRISTGQRTCWVSPTV